MVDALRHPRYEIGTVLAVGGMAEVREGWDRHLGRSVVIKRLRPDRVDAPEMHDWFERELELAPRLAHPGLVSVVDADELAGVPFLVLERLSGETLEDRLGVGPLAAAEARALASQLLGALAAVHAAGIVHGDLKPSNVFRSSEGSWKLGDFGVAVPGLDGPRREITTLAGTPGYLAPERANGTLPTARSDLFELGMTLYEATMGCRPEQPPVPAAQLQRRLEAARNDLDVRLVSTIARCMQTAPWLRPASAQAALVDLGAAGPKPMGRERERLPTVPGTLVAAEPMPLATTAPSPVRALAARLVAALVGLVGVLDVAIRERWYPSARRSAGRCADRAGQWCRATSAATRPKAVALAGTLRTQATRCGGWGATQSVRIGRRSTRLGAAGIAAVAAFATRVGHEVTEDVRDVCAWCEPRLDGALADLDARWAELRRRHSAIEIAVMTAVALVVVGSIVAISVFEA